MKFSLICSTGAVSFALSVRGFAVRLSQLAVCRWSVADVVQPVIGLTVASYHAFFSIIGLVLIKDG